MLNFYNPPLPLTTDRVWGDEGPPSGAPGWHCIVPQRGVLQQRRWSEREGYEQERQRKLCHGVLRMGSLDPRVALAVARKLWRWCSLSSGCTHAPCLSDNTEIMPHFRVYAEDGQLRQQASSGCRPERNASGAPRVPWYAVFVQHSAQRRCHPCSSASKRENVTVRFHGSSKPACKEKAWPDRPARIAPIACPLRVLK